MKAYFHLPGLFEFYELYSIFLPLYRDHREYFYDWAEIGSIYGAPADCIWGGGRVGFGDAKPQKVLNLMQEFEISARLTLSNSMLREEHLTDRKCNALCELFHHPMANSMTDSMTDANIPDLSPSASLSTKQNGVILHSEILLDYLKKNYPDFYFVSSTTKVLTNFEDFRQELKREDFQYVVPDFRLNKAYPKLEELTPSQKAKVEFLCNECCWIGCTDRRQCYENVSQKNLGEQVPDHQCKAPHGNEGYRFSKAMENPAFISVEDIRTTYLPMGFSNFKIEGRGLGSAMVLEFLLYYMVKPEYQVHVREEIYLDSMLDLF